MEEIKNEDESAKEDEKKVLVRVSTMIYSLIIILAVIFVAFVVFAYFSKSKTGIAVGNAVSNFVPLPAAVVNYTNFISIREVNDDLETLQSFYEKQDFSSVGMRVDFSTQDGEKRLQIKKKQLLNKLIEDKVVDILVKKRGVAVSTADVENSIEKKLNEYGNRESVISDLQSRYGWTLDDFKTKVVMPGMHREALAENVKDELLSQQKNAKTKIEKAQKEIAEGKDFSEIAKLYSEGESAKNGGEIGWVKKAQLVPQLGEAVFSSKFDEKEVIQSDLGFHLVDVEDVKKEDGEDVLRVRQIFVKTPTFANWLADQMKLVSVSVPLKGFYWDKETAGVEFSDQTMKEFELKEKEDFKGDASIYF